MRTISQGIKAQQDPSAWHRPSSRHHPEEDICHEKADCRVFVHIDLCLQFEL
ncbi:MAG TPA: hypothetical protein VFL86_22255 [Burkholderiaceae bacterium]|nr:hypothetical protein [Burkholderiaceae bacterium]